MICTIYFHMGYRIALTDCQATAKTDYDHFGVEIEGKEDKFFVILIFTCALFYLLYVYFTLYIMACA
jgi:hypothetical protein